MCRVQAASRHICHNLNIDHMGLILLPADEVGVLDASDNRDCRLTTGPVPCPLEEGEVFNQKTVMSSQPRPCGGWALLENVLQAFRPTAVA